MPWESIDLMSLRFEFVRLAALPEANIRELCRRFNLSPRTAYKWIKRFAAGGAAALADRSRRPLSLPRLTKPAAVQRVLTLRGDHPTWGGLKINKRLRALGQSEVPSPSTITQILRRAGRLDPILCAQHVPFQRFQREAPNELWQLDFKGHFGLAQGRCHPLTALDDHSRYALILAACANEQGPTVQALLQNAFQIYGRPWSILADNGAPWGCSSGPDHFTTLGVWILRLGIQLIHGRPAHPQTQGKEERFNRTLKNDVLDRQDWRDLAQCAKAFDQWRHVYNHERPHQAIGLETPAHFYRPSERAFPPALPAIDYNAGDIVKKVKSKGEITHLNQFYYIGRAFVGLPVALRPTREDGLLEVRFCQQKLGSINLKNKAQSKWTYQSIRP